MRASRRASGRVPRAWREALRVLVLRPGLWPTLARFVPPRWWARWPPLPLPPAGFLRFRMEAMYGPGGALDGDDLVRFLEWCRRTGRPAR